MQFCGLFLDLWYDGLTRYTILPHPKADIIQRTLQSNLCVIKSLFSKKDPIFGSAGLESQLLVLSQ